MDLTTIVVLALAAVVVAAVTLLRRHAVQPAAAPVATPAPAVRVPAHSNIRAITGNVVAEPELRYRGSDAS